MEHFLFIILCQNFIWWFGNLWVPNWHFLFFLYYCFAFFYNSSVRIGSSWLFRTCFHTKIFSKHNFRTHHNVGSSTTAPVVESLKTRNNYRTLVTSPSNILWKMRVWFFSDIILSYYFSLEAACCHG